MITTVCKISYGSQTVPPIVPAVQGDTGRAISFEIADFTPPAGATATYFILKPSGEAIYNSATITDNSILCELTAQSLAEAGENRMQVRVLQGENIVTSFEVILMVRTFLGDNAIESGTEMNIFDQAVEQATEQFQENAEQIVAEVIESIPADYTALTEEVGELNERLDTMAVNVGETKSVVFDVKTTGPHSQADDRINFNVPTGSSITFLVTLTTGSLSGTLVGVNENGTTTNIANVTTGTALTITTTRDFVCFGVWLPTASENATATFSITVNGVITKQIDNLKQVTGERFSTTFISSANHASTSDTLTVNILAGTVFEIKTIFSNSATVSCSYVATLSDDTTRTIAIVPGGESGILALEYDVKRIGVYFPSAGTDVTVTFSVVEFGEFQFLEREVSESNDYAETIIGKKYQTTFISNGNHSSTANRLTVNIKSGKRFSVCTTFSNDATVDCSYSAVLSDNSTRAIASASGGVTRNITLDYDIVAIGVYFPSAGTNVTVDFSVVEFGEFQFVEESVTPGTYSFRSTNFNGLTSTYFKSEVSKKLYIPGESDAITKNQQGSAYENGKMIIATHDLGTTGDNCTLDVWDYANQTRLYSFPIANDAIYHGNNISATGIKIDNSDLCSLLMVSDGKTQGGLHVCRLTESGCTIIHSIDFDIDDVGYIANYLYNDKNGTVVSIGYAKNSVTDPIDNYMVVCVWDIDGWDTVNGTVTKTLRYKYTLPFLDVFNGGIIRNGNLYVMCTPFQFADYTYITVISINGKSISNVWNMDTKAEHENINFIDDTHIIVGSYWFITYQVKNV